MMRTLLQTAVAEGQLRAIDLHAALFLEELAGCPSPSLLLAAALTSRAVGEGHICLPLAAVAGQPVFTPLHPVEAPSLEKWRATGYKVIQAPRVHRKHSLDAGRSGMVQRGPGRAGTLDRQP